MSITVLAALATGATLLLLALVVFIAHKIRRVHLKLFDMDARFERLMDQSLMDLYHQIEASADLRRLLAWDHGLPSTRGWAASPDFLKVVADTIMTTRPRVIVECGSGVSTLVSARCLQLLGHGHVYSLDHESSYATATREHLSKLGLDQFATVIDAPLISRDVDGVPYSWYCPKESLPERIDLLVVDGPPSDAGTLARYPALPLLFGRLASGAEILVDDANRPDEQEMLNRWRVEFPTLLPRLVPSCEKGCMALVKSGNG